MHGNSNGFVGPSRLVHYRAPKHVGASINWSSGQVNGPWTLREIDEMLEDSSVQFGLQAIHAPLHRARLQVRCKDQQVGGYVAMQLKRFWGELEKVLSFIAYGNAAAEVTYTEREGRIELDCLNDVYLGDALPLAVGRELAGIQVQRATDDGRILRPRSLWLAHRPKHGSFWGVSRLRPAWPHWKELAGRDGARDLRRLWYLRDSTDGGTLRFPQGDIQTDAGTRSAESYAQELTEKKKSGGLLNLPSDRDPVTKEYLWVYEPPVARAAGDLRDYLKDVDQDLLRGLGVPPEVLQATGETGSGYAGRSIPAEVFWTGEEQIARAIVAAFKDQIGDPLVAANYGPDVTYEIDVLPMAPWAQQDGQQGQGGGGQKPPGGEPGPEGEGGQGDQEPPSPGEGTPPGGEKPPLSLGKPGYLYREDQHPRGEDGRWIDRKEIRAAARSSEKADDLRAKTRPDDRGKLDAAVAAEKKHQADAVVKPLWKRGLEIADAFRRSNDLYLSWISKGGMRPEDFRDEAEYFGNLAKTATDKSIRGRIRELKRRLQDEQKMHPNAFESDEWDAVVEGAKALREDIYDQIDDVTETLIFMAESTHRAREEGRDGPAAKITRDDRDDIRVRGHRLVDAYGDAMEGKLGDAIRELVEQWGDPHKPLSLGAAFRESDHPRDHKGQFIEKGALAAAANDPAKMAALEKRVRPEDVGKLERAAQHFAKQAGAKEKGRAAADAPSNPFARAKPDLSADAVLAGQPLKIRDSSAIIGAQYDPDRAILSVAYKDYAKTGKLYEYDDVSPAEVRQMLDAESKGGWINRNLKGISMSEAAEALKAKPYRALPFDDVFRTEDHIRKPELSGEEIVAQAVPGRTKRPNQSVSEANQDLISYGLSGIRGETIEGIPGNRAIDSSMFDADGFSTVGIEVKTWLESKEGEVHMDPSAKRRKELYQAGFAVIPASGYKPHHGQILSTETFRLDKRDVECHILRDPIAPPGTSAANPRPVHMLVMDNRDEWAAVLNDKDAGPVKARKWGRQQAYYARGVGSVAIGKDKPPPLICCDGPDAYRELMDKTDAEIEKIASAFQYGGKSYPSGRPVQPRGQSLPEPDRLEKATTDMVRRRAKVDHFTAQTSAIVQRTMKAEKQLAVWQQAHKAMGEPTNQRERQKQFNLELRINKIKEFLQKGANAHLERLRNSRSTYTTKLAKSTRDVENMSMAPQQP